MRLQGGLMSEERRWFEKAPPEPKPGPRTADPVVVKQLWTKCPDCDEVLYNEALDETKNVCPSCGYHLRFDCLARLDLLVDEGSFERHDEGLSPMDPLGFVDSKPYSERIKASQAKTGERDAYVAGSATLDGIPVQIGTFNFRFMGGSMGEVVGEKIARAVELAQEKKMPILIFSASGGARMHEGAISLMQMAKTCSALHLYRESGGFSISILTNPTTGGVTASFASVCDITVAEPGALIGFAGPRVIQNTIRQELPKGFQRSEFLMEKGQVDTIIARPEMKAQLAILLGYSPHARRRDSA